MSRDPTSFSQALALVFQRSGLSPELAAEVIDGRLLPDPGVDAPVLALIATGPPGIQDMIGASRAPVTIVGASTALTNWDRAMSALDGAACVYAGGGQALLVAPWEEATALCEGLRETFKQKLYAPLGVGLLPVSARLLAEGPAGKGFGALVDAVQLLLRADKDRPRPAAPPRSGPRCTECATRERAGGRETCDVCHTFHRDGNEEKVRGPWGLRDAPSIADLSDDMLAYLAVDGTGMGAALREQTSLTAYRRFSHALSRAFSGPAVRVLFERAGVDQMLPVVQGGDDLLFVFDAKAGRGALGMALLLLDHIESTLDQALGKKDAAKLGAGAGLVITRSLPAKEAMDLAHRLIRSGKDAVREAEKANPGQTFRSGLDFEVVYGGDVIASDLQGFRQGRTRDLYLPGNTTPQTLHLGLRPLTKPAAQALMGVATGLSGPEQSALRRIGEALLDDPLSGLITAGSLLARRGGEAPLGPRLGHPHPPWDLSKASAQGLLIRPHRGAWQTAIPELLDFATFAREPR